MKLEIKRILLYGNPCYELKYRGVVTYIQTRGSIIEDTSDYNTENKEAIYNHDLEIVKQSIRDFKCFVDKTLESLD